MNDQREQKSVLLFWIIVPALLFFLWFTGVLPEITKDEQWYSMAFDENGDWVISWHTRPNQRH
ncbi:MAG: hypothetical protein COB14_01640 [Alphaproteobacteria bacterium]|nr:MAG: hypothetical protein COB14_01640 [Alphaproteobacteria bacterium]